MKDKREPILILKGKDINTVMDALETQEQIELDNIFYGKNAKILLKKIKEVMRLE